MSFAPLWWPPGKIAGRYLAPYLAHPGDPALTRSRWSIARRPGETEETDEARAEEREAVELLLEMADANARRGSFDFAVMCLDAAEDVGGPLPAARQADRHRGPASVAPDELRPRVPRGPTGQRSRRSRPSPRCDPTEAVGLMMRELKTSSTGLELT